MKPLGHERAPANDTRTARSDRIDAVVICSDDSLLIELGPILGDRYRTHTVDAPADIGGRIEAARWIGIIDVDSLPDARASLVRMEQQYQRCPLILVATRPEEWAGAITRGTALAALGRQEVSGMRLAEALAVAESRLREPAGSAAGSAHAALPGIGRLEAAARHGAPMLAALAMVLIGAGSFAWLHYAHRGGTAARPSAHTMPVAAAVPTASSSASDMSAAASGASGATPAPAPQGVLELLSAARIAFHDQDLLLPRLQGETRGDSALELYTQVLKQDPGNDEAQDGIRRLLEIGRARVQADLASGRLDDATRLVGMFAGAGVSSDALHDLQASINAARPKWLMQRAQQNIAAGDLATADQLIGQLTAAGAAPGAVAELRQALDARKLELQLQAMAVQVRSALQAGALLDPASDNARTRLTAMRTLARTHPITLAAQHDLQSALLAHAEQATHAAQFDEAQRYLSAAGELGSAAQVSEARRALQAAQTKAAQQQAAAATRVKAAATAASTPPAPVPAPSKIAPAPRYIAAHPVRPLSVSYPDGTNAQGYVVVEFTLEPDGAASDATVVQSAPPQIFDAVALSAVQRGHYSTVRLHGGPMRARILLRFKPN